ncbi:hypothetical protein BH23ACT10_BH23ACT10_24660 [soil metagenome]
MILIKLAHELRDAGLRWEPASGDRFVIPDRDLDDQVFSISEMMIDVRSSPVGRLIAFNGTVEWALDSIMQREVIWLPSEGQLRELLGERFIALERTATGLRCVVDFDGHRMEYTDTDAANAYGHALLHWLLHSAPAQLGSQRG